MFVPHGVVLDEARAVAAEFSLPPWWLNEEASVYVAPGGDEDGPRVFEHPVLRVTAASAEHLLARKVLAARLRDEGDITILVTRLGLASEAQVLALCTEIFPAETIPDRARLMVEDILASIQSHQDPRRTDS